MLDHVCYISSASGGSITNAFITLGQLQGRPFQDLYRELVQKLSGELVLEQAIALLQDKAQWPADQLKQRNLINAFARIYDRFLYEGSDMDVFLNPAHADKLQISINATEFYRGLWFRFHNGQNSFKMGNNYVFLRKPTQAEYKSGSVAGRIKIADVVAASSCFPMGFEPLLLPDDFVNDNLGIDEIIGELNLIDYAGQSTKPEGPVALMDGGITDNQGLRATMDANARIAGDFDLVIVTDVTSYFMHHYEPTKSTLQDHDSVTTLGIVHKIGNALKWIKNISFALILLFLLLMLSLFFVPPATKTIIAGVCLLFLPIMAFGLLMRYFIRDFSSRFDLFRSLNQEDNLNTFKALLSDHLESLTHFPGQLRDRIVIWLCGLPVTSVRKMIWSRLRSGLTMILDVNLKHTRRLIYDHFYDRKEFDDRRCANFIYELSSYNQYSRKTRLHRLGFSVTDQEILTPTPEIEMIAEAARNVGTTLWFEPTDHGTELQKQILVTGQFSTCCNLLEYCKSLLSHPVNPLSPDQLVQVQAWHDRLLEDWNKFKAHPDFLYEELK